MGFCGCSRLYSAGCVLLTAPWDQASTLTSNVHRGLALYRLCDRSAACKLWPHPCQAARMACIQPSSLMQAAMPLLYLVTPKCWLPAVPHCQLRTAPLLSCRCIGLLVAPLPWCSKCAACVACPPSPSALLQVAVQLLRMLSSQAAHLRGLSEELAVQQWLAEVDGHSGPDPVPAQASLWECWLANSRQQAQWLCQSQWGCGQAEAVHLGSVLRHACCLRQVLPCIADGSLCVQ